MSKVLVNNEKDHSLNSSPRCQKGLDISEETIRHCLRGLPNFVKM